MNRFSRAMLGLIVLGLWTQGVFAWNCNTDCKKVACTKILGDRVCEPGTLTSCEAIKHADCVARSKGGVGGALKTIIVPSLVLGPAGTAVGIAVVDKTAQGEAKARRDLAKTSVPKAPPADSGKSYTIPTTCVLVGKKDPSTILLLFASKPEAWADLAVTDTVITTSGNSSEDCSFESSDFSKGTEARGIVIGLQQDLQDNNARFIIYLKKA